MFGCHNCSYDLKNYDSYESSPCASCKTKQNPPPVSKYRDDPATFNSLKTLHPAYFLPDEMADVSDKAIEMIFSSLAKTVRLLIHMKEKYPETYKFVDAKITEPFLSYSQLAERFTCKKQNVLYHLKKAVDIYPELSSAIIVDARFSHGHHALKSQKRNMIRNY